MHVLMVPAWYDPTGVTPAGSFVMDTAKAVSGAGWKSGLLYLDRGSGNERWTKQKGSVNVVAARKLLPPKLGILRRPWLNGYRKLLDEYVSAYGPPDILHAHSYIAGVAAAHLSSLAGMPMVLTEHAMGVIEGVPARHRKTLKDVYSKADLLLAVSAHLGEAMQAYCPGRKVVVVPNPVDTRVFTIAPSADQADSFTYIWIGSEDPVKNLELALRAFAIVRKSEPRACLRIVGIGDQRIVSVTSDIDKRLAEAITVDDYLPREEVINLMQSADCLLSTSKIETFGMVAAEAMACGLPVVTTPNKGIPALVNNKNGIVSRDMSPDAVAGAMLDVFRKRRTYDKMHIRAHVVKNYSYSRIGERLVGLYTEILSENAQ